MDEKLLFLEKRVVEITKCPDGKLDTLKHTLSHFKSDLKIKLRATNYKHERFLKNNAQWLKSSLSFATSQTTTEKPGRPSKEFGESSERTKRRKTKDLREKVPVEELTFAAQMSHRAEGNKDVSKIIKDLTFSPTRATKFRKILYSTPENKIKKHTPSEALAIFVEGDFSKRQWNILHSSNKNIYPCYSLLQKAKMDCYPDELSIRVTETCAEVKLQDLLNHTCLRLCIYLEPVIETLTEEEKSDLELFLKWGCDGSQQSQFKVKFENAADSDSNIFQSSLVPLRLQLKSSKKILWQNPVPSSPRFCRPIRMRFISESKDVTNEEINYVESQAESLNKTEVPSASGMLYISHKLLLTMVDGKVCNAATNTTSTMRCYICGLTSKNFNNLVKGVEVDPESLKFGLSILHARIRFFETLLHVSYKLPLKKWQIRTSEEKKIIKERKERIQKAFREEMGLLVDIPKAGFGNTNDGNTSRRFFSDPETASRITGIDITLINKLKVILETISSGHAIDAKKFEDYAFETATLYVQLYGWHPMSPTLHKILIHGAAVISHFMLPIGQLSEEAAEARNKHFRLYRQNFSRKFDRVKCNRDILNRLLLTSDPLLSSNRKQPRKKSKPFSSETLSLLLPEGMEVDRELSEGISDADNDEDVDEEYDDDDSDD